MKRMKKLLACALAALLLILPAAMAEESAMVEAHTITIENPSMTMMGIPMADLDGLSLEATYAGDENDCAFLLRLLGGEEVAAEGYALFDGRQLVLGADGLTDTYAVPLEKMMGDMGSVNSAEMEMLMQLFSPDTYTAIFEAAFTSTEGMYEAMAATRTDLGTQTVEIGGVAMEAQGVSYTITAEMAEEVIISYAGALEQIPLFAMALEQAGTALSPDGYNDEKNAAGNDLESMLRSNLTALGDSTYTAWYVGDPAAPEAVRTEESSEDGRMTAVMEYILQEDGNYTYTWDYAATLEDGSESGLTVEGTFAPSWVAPAIIELSDPSGLTEAVLAALADPGMMDMRFTADMGEEGVMTGAFSYYPQGSNAQTADRTTFAFNATIEESDVEPMFMNLEGYYAPADGVEYFHDECVVTLNAGTASQNGTIEAVVQTQHADGQEYYGAELTISDPYSGAQSLFYTYEGTYAANELGTEDNTGHLTLGAGIGYGDQSITYEVGADVTVTHALVDAATLPAIEGEPVDILMLDEKGEEQLMTEGELMATRALGILMANVPAVTQLFAGATAY